MSDPIGRAALSAFQRIGDGARPVPFTRPDGAAPTGAGSFGETLTRAINEVSAAQENSAAMTQSFVNGEPVELHQVMAAAEEAGIALEMLVEVRNKVVEAYRTVVNMQS